MILISLLKLFTKDNVTLPLKSKVIVKQKM